MEDINTLRLIRETKIENINSILSRVDRAANCRCGYNAQGDCKQYECKRYAKRNYAREISKAVNGLLSGVEDLLKANDL